MRSIANALSRGAAALVIDHHTVHHAPNTVSVHIQERDTTGATLRGLDIDNVTVEELGATGEIAKAIDSAKLLAFVAGVSGGMPVTMDVLPPAPKVDAPVAEKVDGASAP